MFTADDGGPKVTLPVVIGISIAIVGNVLISLALNLQKLAHRRVEQTRPPASRPLRKRRSALPPRLTSLDLQESPQVANEEQPLLAAFPAGRVREDAPTGRSVFSYRWLVARTPKWQQTTPKPTFTVGDTTPQHGDGDNISDEDDETIKDPAEFNESGYLGSKLWWFGFLLMNVGELGNFISYAFAPASVVAPLGTFALIANCFFAPLLQGERFRKRDLAGILLAVIGAVTVVLSTNASDIRFSPEELVEAISQRPFVIYSLVYVVGAVILTTISEGKYGKRWVFVDVGLCALYGGFTVLSTKAVSTLLTLQWIEMFTNWITYPVLVVLVGTGVAQVRYLNRALMKFDSKVVIPSQFVLFNLSVITGSAILYGDFKKATFYQMMNFLYGCVATFGGVFIIAWSSAAERAEGEEEREEEAEAEDDGDQRLSDVDEQPVPISPRRRLIIPHRAMATPILRHQRSSLSIIGVSPAQHLFLQTPPELSRERNHDIERDVISTPDSYHRRRTASWLENEGRRTRETSRSRPSPAPTPTYKTYGTDFR